MMHSAVTPEFLKRLSPKGLAYLRTEVKRRIAENKLFDYKPYPKQLAFHIAGKTFRERLLMAGNQLGKTIAGGSEHAIHATGIYPKWWAGKVFEKPIVSWAAGVTGEVTRDSVQRILAGRANQLGTGTIPKDRIKDHTLKRGVADAIDTIYVKHGGGGDIQSGESIITFKSYDQGRTKFQSETLDWVWFDEEPDLDIYIEGLTRTNNTDGCVAMTFTPLFGMSQVVKRFTVEKPASTTVIQMGIEDAEHYTPERRAEIIASYPAHERDARAKGIPVLGSGAVFPVAESEIVIEPIPIAAHWARLSAIDFGWDHPFAWVKVAHDRDTDTVYLFDEYSQREKTPKDHVADLRVKPEFDWVPVVWPHDGLQHDKGSGVALADTYRHLGLPLMQEKFSNPPAPGEDEGSGGNGVEAGIMEMLTRMQTGRFKVFSTCQKWLSEFRLYHRVNGKIEAIDDDVISASRLCVMSLRHAITKPVPVMRRRAAVGVSNW
jgi:phage terminase large subunit-like protein